MKYAKLREDLTELKWELKFFTSLKPSHEYEGNMEINHFDNSISSIVEKSNASGVLIQSQFEIFNLKKLIENPLSQESGHKVYISLIFCLLDWYFKTIL